MVELGSGAASKTVALLDAALAAGGKPRYVAVDISAHALQRTQEILAAERPEILVEQVLADYTQQLQLPRKPAGGRRLVLPVADSAPAIDQGISPEEIVAFGKFYFESPTGEGPSTWADRYSSLAEAMARC